MEIGKRFLLRLRDYLNNKLKKKIEMGQYSYGNPKVIRNGGDSIVKIGKFCSIAKDVTFLLLNNHRTDWISTYPFFVFRDKWKNSKNIKSGNIYRGDIVVGNDVWIGYGAKIISGVTIGDGAVIAANSYVVTNVPPYTIFGGNPARIIRKRFKDRDIKTLLEIKWWDWPKKNYR